MFALGILIGIYSNLIFSLGVLGVLYKSTVLSFTLIFILSAYYYFRKNPIDFPRVNLRNKPVRPFLAIFAVMSAVNLIGALGPELSFDALWYHLTIPKIFIDQHQIFYIPGGLLYYSLMPKLGEMLFIPGLMFGNEIVPKLTQWVFGILTSFIIYKISRKYLSEKFSYIAVLIFYSSLVVAWESTVAYIDLIRTFFEAMSLWGILKYFEKKESKWLIEAAVMLGLAISTKINALGSIPIFIALFFLFGNNKREALKESLFFGSISVLIASPWFFFSFLNTNNPFFPFFSAHFIDLEGSLVTTAMFNPIKILKSLAHLFFFSSDPLSPIYIAFFPLFLISFRRFGKQIRIIATYCLLGLIVWYPFANVGGSRFMLAYLPAFSVLSVAVIAQTKSAWLRKYLILLIVFVCFVTVGYRALANLRYLPVILGQQTKDEFLTKNLNFSFGDFYDTDGYFKKTIRQDDRVLLFGFHNLYYANFPFIHSSYIKKGDKFNYIVTQNADLPKRFSHWRLIHRNNITGVSVYTMEKEIWYY